MYYFPEGLKEINLKVEYRHVIEAETLANYLLD